VFSLIVGYTDYENFSEVLAFNRNSTEVCHSINITDDEECEYDGCESELFLSHLSTDDYNIHLINDTVSVIIQDIMEDECSKSSSAII